MRSDARCHSAFEALGADAHADGREPGGGPQGIDVPVVALFPSDVPPEAWAETPERAANIDVPAGRQVGRAEAANGEAARLVQVKQQEVGSRRTNGGDVRFC